jgi:hypothetical protein
MMRKFFISTVTSAIIVGSIGAPTALAKHRDPSRANTVLVQKKKRATQSTPMKHRVAPQKRK